MHLLYVICVHALLIFMLEVAD